jgi:hypothetical protein
MDMPNELKLVSIFTKLVNRHFIGDSGETQLTIKDLNENSDRASTAKSSSISITNIGLKDKLSTQALKCLESLCLIIERIVKGIVENKKYNPIRRITRNFLCQEIFNELDIHV